MSHHLPAPLPTAADVKEYLLPLAPAQAALEWLIERLPRQRLPVAIQPLREVEVKNEAAGRYLSTGASPTFSLVTTDQLTSGWYYFETAIMRSNGSRHAEIKCQYTTGQTVKIALASSIPVSSNLRGSVREVIYIPQGVCGVEWVPTKARGFFTQRPISLHKISVLESGLRRWHRVISDLWRFRHAPLGNRTDLNLKTASHDLQTAYIASTHLRLKRTSGFDYPNYLANLEKQKKLSMPAFLNFAKHSCSVTISIVMVVGKNDQSLLKEFFESLKQQSYSRWELLLVGDCTASFISQFYDLVPNQNIRHILLGNNTLADVLNVAVQSSVGNYVLRMPSAYVLSDDALLQLALVVSKNPSAKIIYFDEDTIGHKTSERVSPCFRPDWNPELLHSHHYMGKCIAYSKKFLGEKGLYRQGFEAAEDYDLILRLTQQSSADDVIHIRQIVFHRQGQVRLDDCVDSNQHAAAKHALQDNLKGIASEVIDGAVNGFFRIRYPLPAT